jgi:hypothetical protein
MSVPGGETDKVGRSQGCGYAEVVAAHDHGLCDLLGHFVACLGFFEEIRLSQVAQEPLLDDA